LAADSGFNGINLLDKTNSADLTLTLNETGSSTVTVAAVDFTAAGDLAINSAANNWATTTETQAAATDLSAALTTLRT
jgi:flagellin